MQENTKEEKKNLESNPICHWCGAGVNPEKCYAHEEKGKWYCYCGKEVSDALIKIASSS
jgi:hypothetical protein